jgi:glycosyltransferase involved in cell wall biosynthesis
VLACVANFDPVKGQDTLAEAFLILVEKHPEAKLIFAGSTLPNPGAVALSMRVRSMLNERMQSGQVIFLDPCRDVRSVLAAADIYIQPSNSEALSVAIGEAMACGLPVVATSAGGNPEIVIGEHTGILVSPADPPGMSRAVGRLIADRGLRERLGREGHEFARAFLTPRAMLAAYGRIYEELLRPARISRDAVVSQREGLR